MSTTNYWENLDRGKTGRAWMVDNLSRMRKFYVVWSKHVTQFPRDRRGNSEVVIRTECEGRLTHQGIQQTRSANFITPFRLSWSHYVLLLTVKDDAEQSFYEIEAANESWSVAKLKRQVASCLYERLALS